MMFVKKLQMQPKIKSVKKRIGKNEAARKKLSREYKRLIKSESKRLKKKTPKRKPKRKPAKKKRR